MVGGRPARYVVVRPSKGPYFTLGQVWLAVDVGSGVWLTVSVVFESGEAPSAAELTSVVAATTIGRPDLSWIGSRPN
jgi:hypothetical protein